MGPGNSRSQPAGDGSERPKGPPAKDMLWIQGATFLMGSENFYPEESPARRVAVDGFWIDEHLVTVAEFRRFVKDTGYVTMAERAPDPADYPDHDPDLLVPGSLVFQKAKRPVDLSDHRNWWAYVPGADWRHPEGQSSTLHGRERHPVTHVTVEDAMSYAAWAAKDLPTEAEWELAARGGLEGAVFPWGDEFAPKGKMMANTWQGEFPWQNLEQDGYEGTSPIKSFPPNGYGLYDMAGNVWEWTSDYFTSVVVQHSCCVPQNPRVDTVASGFSEERPGERFPRKVMKGGSHLCAPNYCLRYRPAARQGETIETSTSHIGFRCVVRPKEPSG
jgi:formylglycine-generating enzyme required for sulfatase activity